jgi:hypothetical protein
MVEASPIFRMDEIRQDRMRCRQISAAGSRSILCFCLFSGTYKIVAYKFYNLNSRCKCLRKSPCISKRKSRNSSFKKNYKGEDEAGK